MRGHAPVSPWVLGACVCIGLVPATVVYRPDASGDLVLSERTRPDGRGGTEVEREVQRADVNGRFQTVSTSRVRSSGQ